MNWRKKLIRFLLWDGMSKEEYASIRPVIHEKTREKMVWFNALAASVFTLLLITSLFVPSIAAFRYVYLLLATLTVAMLVAILLFGEKHPIVVAVVHYMFCTLAYGFSIYIGTVGSPYELATSFVAFLVLLPLLTHDTILCTICFRTGVIIAFYVVAFYTKDPAVYSVDLVNAVCYSVVAIVASAFVQHAQAQGYYLANNMASEINKQTHLLEKQANEVQSISLQAMVAMAAAIDAKDTYTNGHSERVARYAKMIAERAGKSPEEQDEIFFVALLHDVGKIGIPDEIINKPSHLTDEEFDVIKSHPTIGYGILKKIENHPEVATGALYHHERYDGSGYPKGIAGTEIPEVARIIAVADAYDAMTSDRSYRVLMSRSAVLEEIRKGRGTQFDPAFADIMVDIIEEDSGYSLHE